MTRAHPVQDAVLAALADGEPRTAVAIEVASGLRQGQVFSSLAALVRLGLVVRAGWRVTRGSGPAAIRFGAFPTTTRTRLWRLAPPV